MDLSKFKLLKEDDSCYHVGHPNGKTLVVDKKGLSERSRNVIKKYYAGDVVSNDPPEGSGDQAAVSMEEGLAKAGMSMANPVRDSIIDFVNKPLPENDIGVAIARRDAEQRAMADQSRAPAVDPSIAQSAALPEEVAQASAEQSVASPGAAAPALSADVLGKEQGQISKYIKDSEAISQDMAKSYDDYQKQAADAVVAQKASQDAYKVKEDAFAQQLAQGKVDPNRYYSNMSTGNKIAASIAMIFGGLAGGLSGDNSNVALDMMNKAIEKDIDAQKSEQDKVQNLFKMNHEAMQDDRAAHALTQNQLWTTAQAKIAKSAELMKDPARRLQAEQMIGKLEAQKQANRVKLSMMSSGGASNQPLKAIEVLVPEKERTKAREEAEAVRSYQNGIRNIKKLYNDVSSIGPIGGNAPFSKDKAKMESVRAQINGIIRGTMKGQGAITDNEEKSIINPYLPAAGDTAAQAKIKLNGLINNLKNRQTGTPILDTYGVKISPEDLTASLSPEDMQKVAYAKAHPDDPRSALWLKKLGVD